MLIYQDARFAVRPMAGVCERHIPMVRLALANAVRWQGPTPLGGPIFRERLQIASQRLDDARIEALAMLGDVSETLQLDQLTLAAALRDGGVLPEELRMSAGQVEGPMASIFEALRAGLVDLAEAGNVSQRTIAQHRLLVPIVREAGGTLLDHVATAAWAGRMCWVTRPPAEPKSASAEAWAASRDAGQPMPLDDDAQNMASVGAEMLQAAVGDSKAGEEKEQAARPNDDSVDNRNGPVNVEEYFARRRRRAEGGEEPKE
jgi:hypothetical protein